MAEREREREIESLREIKQRKREREKRRERERERARASMCMCAGEREIKSAFVCLGDHEREERDSVCVRETRSRIEPAEKGNKECLCVCLGGI